MFSDRCIVHLSFTLIWVFIGSSAGGAQGRPARQPGELFNAMPSVVEPQITALGRRVTTPGKELTVFTGEFIDETGNRLPVRIVHQLPGLVHVQGARPGGGVVAFDGQQAYGLVTRMDAVVLETFLADLPEGMLSSVQRGAAMRLLGRGFKPNARVAPRYNGPRYDIYEVTEPVVASRSDGVVRMKFYYFDSQSGLLLSTRYTDSTLRPAVRVETQFSEWRTVEGSAYPGRIRHYEDGRLVFSFNLATVSAGPRVDAANFR